MTYWKINKTKFLPQLITAWFLMLTIINKVKADTNCNETFKLHDDFYYYGDLITIINNVSDIVQCVNLCADTKKCVSINYRHDILKCELMNGVSDPHLNKDYFSETKESTFAIIECPETKRRIKRQTVRGECGRSSVPMRKAVARIVGGFEAKPFSFPWVVSLVQRNRHFCGGSLISVGNLKQSDMVATAAHCVAGLSSPRFLAIKYGCSDISQKSCPMVVADKIYVHPKFDLFTATNDIALVKLQVPISFSAKAQPICLPPPGDTTLKPGIMATVVGWGSLSENGPGTNHLMQVDLPIMDFVLCNSKTFYDGQLDPKIMICAGYAEGKKDSCQGDSGGPLTIQRNNSHYLTGLVSFGQGCARPNFPGIYTKVDAFRSWIDQQITLSSSLIKLLIRG